MNNNSSITIDKITICNPDAKFTDEIILDIEFQCSKPMKTPVTWKVIYMGSGDSHEYDQIMRSIDVGPTEVGINRVVFRAKPPKAELIPFDELPLAMINIKAFYKDQEFFRACYFVSHEIGNASSLEELDLSTVIRQIESDNPTIHTFQINWQ